MAGLSGLNFRGHQFSVLIPVEVRSKIVSKHFTKD